MNELGPMAHSDLLFFPLATLPGALETFLFLLESGMEGARDWRARMVWSIIRNGTGFEA